VAALCVPKPRLLAACVPPQPDKLQASKPELYAKCLQLLDVVAESPFTCAPVLALLHPREGAAAQLLPELASLLVAPLPARGGRDAGVHELVRPSAGGSMRAHLVARTTARRAAAWRSANSARSTPAAD
jgi:hypothetical protein